MSPLSKTLIAMAALALAYPVIAANTASAPTPGQMPQEMTREEFIKHAGERFDAMDTNKDGKLTRDEFRAAHQGRHASGVDHGMMRHHPNKQ